MLKVVLCAQKPLQWLNRQAIPLSTGFASVKKTLFTFALWEGISNKIYVIFSSFEWKSMLFNLSTYFAHFLCACRSLKSLSLLQLSMNFFRLMTWSKHFALSTGTPFSLRYLKQVLCHSSQVSHSDPSTWNRSPPPWLLSISLDTPGMIYKSPVLGHWNGHTSYQVHPCAFVPVVSWLKETKLFVLGSRSIVQTLFNMFFTSTVELLSLYISWMCKLNTHE